MINLADKTKALEQLKKQKSSLEAKKQLIVKVLAGIKAVAHHVKVTSRLKDSILKEIGEKYVVYLEHGGVKVWGNGIEYERLTVYGDTFEKLIEDATNAITGDRYDTKQIDLTISNIEQANLLLGAARKLQEDIEKVLPALHYLRGIRQYEQLYDIKAVYITRKDLE